MSAPAGFAKWQYWNGSLVSGRYSIEWVPYNGEQRCYRLFRGKDEVEMFPDDVGMLFAAMEAAYEDAQGARL